MEKENLQIDLHYFIFDPEKHAHYIESFLQKASKAHGQEARSQAWFLWKFFKNPYGPSILACVASATELIGCVAYGKQPFSIEGKMYEGVISFETFVDPNYQGQGLFSKLLKFAEDEVKRQDIKIMLNFPNSQSLPGFLRKEWQPLNISAYYIRPRFRFNLLAKITHLKLPFVSLPSNLKELKELVPEAFDYKIKSSHEAFITLDFIKYRFFSFPNGNYRVYRNNDTFAIGRMGNRGGLTELQVLLINAPKINSKTLSKAFKGLTKGTKVDIVSYPTSLNSVMVPILKKQLFVKVPNKANVCYKILDKQLQTDMTKLELSAINFHTY